jgi:hypothetical protein
MATKEDGRLQSDGSIIFPIRGAPPKCDLPGYMVDPTDDFRWIMIYCPCKHRVLRQRYICNNGQERFRDFCELLKLPINPAYCNQACKVVDR